jgi:hypothetical protein
MDSGLTIACFPGGMWLVGRKERISGEDYLVAPVLFIHGTQGMGVMSLPGVQPRKNTLKLPLVDSLFDYVVENQDIEDAYIEHTTGVRPMRAPLVGNVVDLPRGGGGPRLQ